LEISPTFDGERASTYIPEKITKCGKKKDVSHLMHVNAFRGAMRLDSQGMFRKNKQCCREEQTEHPGCYS